LKSYRRKVEAVRSAYRHPSNGLKGMQGTWWKLFNSVSYAVDHHPLFNKRRGTPRVRQETKFLNLVDGDSADLKARALTVAVQMAGLSV
jgi:hypothetical protein